MDRTQARRPRVPSAAAARRAAEHDRDLTARTIARTAPQWYEDATTPDGAPYLRFYRLAAHAFRSDHSMEMLAWTDGTTGAALPIAGDALALVPMGAMSVGGAMGRVGMRLRVERVVATEPGTRGRPFAGAARLIVR